MKPVLSHVKEYTAWWNEISISKKKKKSHIDVIGDKPWSHVWGRGNGSQKAASGSQKQWLASCAASCTTNSVSLLPLGSPSCHLLRTREALPV